MDGSILLKMMFGSKNDQQLLEVWFRWDLVFAWTSSSSGLGSVCFFYFFYLIFLQRQYISLLNSRVPLVILFITKLKSDSDLPQNR